MYKKQLVFQKAVCLTGILVAALSFVYSLGIITDIYDSLYFTMMNPNDLTDTWVSGSIIYYDMQVFNKQFTTLSIVLILLGCFLYLTNTHTRRKYYLGNYVATALYSVASIGVAVWSHIQISAFKVQYLTTVDFEALKKFAEMWKSFYTDSTFLLDAHYVVGGLSVLTVILLVFNVVWKIRLMRAENKLIQEGKEAAV